MPHGNGNTRSALKSSTYLVVRRVLVAVFDVDFVVLRAAEAPRAAARPFAFFSVGGLVGQSALVHFQPWLLPRKSFSYIGYSHVSHLCSGSGRPQETYSHFGLDVKFEQP